MEEKGIKKLGLIIKTWERCKSIGRGGSGGSSSPRAGLGRNMSWNSGSSSPADEGRRRGNRRQRVAPEGCFPVYVGAERRKFLVKTEHANHPLFRVFLEEAEAEYGYSSGGPIELPCDADLFHRVLVEMESDDRVAGKRHGCGFATGYAGAYHLLSPSRLISMNNQF